VVMVRGGAIVASGPTASTVNSQNLSALYGRPVEVAEVRSAGGSLRRVCIPSGVSLG
jgi:hypothetical protein